MFPDNFLRKEHCSYPFAFQVDEALYKLLTDHCSRAGVTGFFGAGGRLRHQLAGRAGAEPAAMLTSPALVNAGGGMAYHCPRALQISRFTLWCSSAKLHVGSFSVSPCSPMQTPPGSQSHRMKNSSFLLARILNRHMHTLSVEHVSSNTDLHGAIHMLEPLHIWERGREGHLVLWSPVLHATGGDPTQERTVKQDGAELYSYFSFHHLWPC